MQYASSAVSFRKLNTLLWNWAVKTAPTLCHAAKWSDTVWLQQLCGTPEEQSRLLSGWQLNPQLGTCHNRGNRKRWPWKQPVLSGFLMELKAVGILKILPSGSCLQTSQYKLSYFDSHPPVCMPLCLYNCFRKWEKEQNSLPHSAAAPIWLPLHLQSGWVVGSFGMLKPPQGNSTFVTLPQGKPQQPHGSIRTFTSSIADARSCSPTCPYSNPQGWL